MQGQVKIQGAGMMLLRLWSDALIVLKGRYAVKRNVALACVTAGRDFR